MPENHEKVTRKPAWLKIKLRSETPGAPGETVASRLEAANGFAQVSRLVRENALHTICTSGKCPNQAECWSRRTATFMILGDICTRSCRFCATKTGKPLPADPDEPEKVARSVSRMELRYCVLTSVDRDDLPDGGAARWAETVRAVRRLNPDTKIEVLLPDFDGNRTLLDIVLDAGPDVAGHNIETVERLTPLVRSRARYRRSLDVLRHIVGRGIPAKSGLMLGLGETEEDVLRTLDDLAETGCSLLTIGQYLQPTRRQLEVAEYVHPDRFARYREEALKRGFAWVESAPLVRSSYRADRAAEKCGIK